jgi:membrane protein implicated in regulation of membrane protease activity
MEIRKAWKSVPKPVRQVIALVIGGTLMAIGGLLIVLPGPFTLPFVFAGLVVLAAEFVWAERFLERTKEQAKKVDPRKLLKKKPPRENS